MHNASGALPAAVAKTHRNLLPLFVLLVCFTYIDRTSLSFAALQLCHLDWFNARVFGLGSAAFTLSYVLLQVPSNLALQRLGPKTWLPLITAAWGVVSMCCAAISGPATFYLLRVMLGAAEAGCFPGMWWTCEQFYPPQHITFAYSAIEAAIALAQILAAPLAAALLATDGRLGLAGWQTLFMVQGAATVAFAGVLRLLLPASVEEARFLDDADRRWLKEQLQPGVGVARAGEINGTGNGQPAELELGRREGKGTPDDLTADDDDRLLLDRQERDDNCSAAVGILDGHGLPSRPLSALQQIVETARNRRIWWLVAIKILKDCSLDALVYWTPVLIHALLAGGTVPLASGRSSSGSSDREGPAGEKQCGGKDTQLQAVLLTLVPFGLAAAASLAIGHSSEISGERRLHIGLPLLVGGLAFGVMPFFLHVGSVVGAFICVVLAVMAADATTGPFWSLVLSAAPGVTAVALPAVNSLGKLGGAVGPLSFGLLSYSTGSLLGPILVVTGALLGAGALAVAYRDNRITYAKLRAEESHVQTGEEHVS